MQEQFVDLKVGQSCYIGELKVTLLEVEGKEIYLRIDTDEFDAELEPSLTAETVTV